jgi:hypothetical protein
MHQRRRVFCPLSRLRRQLPQRGSQVYALPCGNAPVILPLPLGWRSHAAKLRCPKGAERASNLLHHRPRSIQNHHRSWRWSPSPVTRAGSQQRWRKCRLTAEGGPPLCLVGQAETVGTAVDEVESSPPSQSAKLTAPPKGEPSLPPVGKGGNALPNLPPPLGEVAPRKR